VVVGDVHLGSAGREEEEEAFHDFLEQVPSFGTRLVVAGDLFDFWFEYRSVVPRRPFRTVARLAALAERGTAVDLVGGNHDRWGGSFWSRDLGIPFHADGSDLDLAGRRAHVRHGDGLTESRLGARVLQRVLRSPVAIAAFRALHPSVGFALADVLSETLGESNRSGAAAQQAARAQERWARTLLDRRPELALVVLGHTHVPALIEHAPGRWYLNVGQWMGDRTYAVVSAERISLCRWPERPRD